MGVRTEDEHPLTRNDIKLFKQNFFDVKTEYYWLTTLVIFLIMYLLQRRDPNKERYWKKIVDEGDKWKWIYKPLAIIDRILLSIFPPLKFLCWNVVITASKPKNYGCSSSNVNKPVFIDQANFIHSAFYFVLFGLG